MILTTIICTHNPRRDYLDRVLEALKSQTLPRDQWELLLIDNASEKLLADELDLSWHPLARHIREEHIGLTHARLRAINEATGDPLVFVDDDNLLDEGYLERGRDLGKKYPFLGVWGGSCVPEFEAEPPAYLEKYLNRLAVAPVSCQRWSNSYSDYDAIPPGAGMLVRRVVAEVYRDNVLRSPLRQRLGATGSALGRCDDTDLAWTAIDCGFGCGRFPDMTLTHIIPRGRIEPVYMLELIKGGSCSEVILDYDRGQPTRITGRDGFILIRSLWLRFRMSDFDFRAWQAARCGIQLGLRIIEAETAQITRST